jgi:transcriptional regulator with XRE-family HTH domain
MIVANGESPGTGVETFAAELRAWRQRLGWSQVELGANIGYSDSHVSSVETTNRTPTLDFAKRCDESLQTPGTFERLHELITKEAYPPWFSPFVHFEARATRIHCWDMRCLTGLLQTEDYARSIIRAGHPDASPDTVERDVAARMERQCVLDREHPPFCWFVVHEAVFRTMFGADAVMRSQLDHLAGLAERPHVTVQVYPFAAPDCPGAGGPVTIFDFSDGPSVGYAEGYEAGRSIEAPPEVAKLLLMFDHLRASAMSPRESARLISNYGSEYGE